MLSINPFSSHLIPWARHCPGRRCGRGRHTLKASEPEEAEAEVFGGKLEAEVLAAVEAGETRASQLKVCSV